MSYHYGSNNSQSSGSTSGSTSRSTTTPVTRSTNLSIRNTGVSSNVNRATGSNPKDKLLTIDNDNFDIMINLIFETLANKKGKRSQRTLKNGLTFQKLHDELKETLDMAKQIVEGTAGEDRKNFGTCKCTNPPSLGFCIEGLCVKANFNFNKLEGSLTITIPF
tara:strand:- start:3950 stop:4438 length:489 start_codon:yes stop_codon:yes gene_type:complete